MLVHSGAGMPQYGAKGPLRGLYVAILQSLLLLLQSKFAALASL